MKKLLYTLALSTFLWSCGGGGGETPPPPEPENNAPSAPSLVYPTNNLLCIDNVLDFDWNSSTDPDGDALTYQVQVAKDAQFTQIAHTQSSISGTLKTLTLDKGVAYYWKVKAVDSKNASSEYSSVYQFYTEGEGVSNHLPFSPVLVSPELSSVVTESTANLQWTASDVDTADTLSYDVYFGTENPPSVLSSENQSTSSLEVNLASSTTYYWKVIVKDGQGGQTIGQIWNFSTD